MPEKQGEPSDCGNILKVPKFSKPILDSWSLQLVGHLPYLDSLQDG